MKYILTGLIFTGLVLSLNVPSTNAAPAKSKGPGSATDNQSKEITITGVVTLSNDAKTYILKETKNLDWINKIWYLPPDSKFKFNEYEALEIEAACTLRGGNIISVKKINPLDKAAYAAKLEELKTKAAEEKKAAQKKKSTAK